MEPIGWHIGMRFADDRVIARTVEERRLLARAVSRHGERAGLAAWRAVDTHMHAELFGRWNEVARFGRSVGSALHAGLGRGVPMRITFAKPIREQWHAQSTFRYVIAQEAHHGLRSDPLHEASNLPDLLGLRLVGGYTRTVLEQHLPRIQDEELFALLGRDALAGPVTLSLLPDAAAAAFALSNPCGRRPEAVAARRAAVHAAKDLVCVERLTEVIAVGPRTVARLHAQPRDPAAVTAVMRQWRLRSAAAAAAREHQAEAHAAPSR